MDGVTFGADGRVEFRATKRNWRLLIRSGLIWPLLVLAMLVAAVAGGPTWSMGMYSLILAAMLVHGGSTTDG